MYGASQSFRGVWLPHMKFQSITNHTIARRALRAGHILLLACGVAFLLALYAGFSSYPVRLYRWLANPRATLEAEPQLIVVLGGGGIPSESGLIRTYYAARAAHRHPEAEIILALPEPRHQRHTSLERMRRELIMRGVDGDRILLAPYGANTRAQAVEVARMQGDNGRAIPLLLVTSPEHMRRAVGAFQQAGFTHVGHQASYDTFDHADITLTTESAETAVILAGVDDNMTLRYHLWGNFNLLTRSSRELTALMYYKTRGWI